MMIFHCQLKCCMSRKVVFVILLIIVSLESLLSHCSFNDVKIESYDKVVEYMNNISMPQDRPSYNNTLTKRSVISANQVIFPTSRLGSLQNDHTMRNSFEFQSLDSPVTNQFKNIQNQDAKWKPFDTKQDQTMNTASHLSQEDTEHLERYLLNQNNLFSLANNFGVQPFVDMHKINDRKPIIQQAPTNNNANLKTMTNNIKMGQETNKQYLTPNKAQQQHTSGTLLNEGQQIDDDGSHREDVILPEESNVASHRIDGDDLYRKKVKLDNMFHPNKHHPVLLPKQLPVPPNRMISNNGMTPFYANPQSPLFKSPIPLLKSDNCVSRAEKLIQSCEGNFIDKLRQDATHGRTVVDVERRICCALFRNRDCVSGKTLEVCPDSSPAARNILLGPRKYHLSVICQRFNLEGCNSSSYLSASFTLIVALQIAIVIFHYYQMQTI